MAEVDRTVPMDMGKVTHYTGARYPVLRKFHVGQHPLLIEDQMREMRPLPMTERATVDHVVRALHTAANDPLDGRLSQKEVSKWRQRKILESLPDNVNHWFAMEFTRWLRGVSQFNNPQVTWWGNHNLFHVPEVVDYLKELVRMRMDYQQRLLMMTVALPKNLKDCWLYFKYIVAGHGLLMREEDMNADSDFWQEQDDNPPQYMSIGGMLDFLDDFSQTTFYQVDLPAMRPRGTFPPVIQKDIEPLPDGNVQQQVNNTGASAADPEGTVHTDPAGGGDDGSHGKGTGTSTTTTTTTPAFGLANGAGSGGGVGSGGGGGNARPKPVDDDDWPAPDREALKHIRHPTTTTTAPEPALDDWPLDRNALKQGATPSPSSSSSSSATGSQYGKPGDDEPGYVSSDFESDDEATVICKQCLTVFDLCYVNDDD